MIIIRILKTIKQETYLTKHSNPSANVLEQA